jgi:hypothetical protein
MKDVPEMLTNGLKSLDPCAKQTEGQSVLEPYLQHANAKQASSK